MGTGLFQGGGGEFLTFVRGVGFEFFNLREGDNFLNFFKGRRGGEGEFSKKLVFPIKVENFLIFL